MQRKRFVAPSLHWQSKYLWRFLSRWLEGTWCVCAHVCIHLWGLNGEGVWQMDRNSISSYVGSKSVCHGDEGAELWIHRSIYLRTLSYSHKLRQVWSSSTLRVEPLLLGIKRNQLRQLRLLVRMSPGCLHGEVFEAWLMGRRPRVRDRTCCRDTTPRT